MLPLLGSYVAALALTLGLALCGPGVGRVDAAGGNTHAPASVKGSVGRPVMEDRDAPRPDKAAANAGGKETRQEGAGAGPESVAESSAGVGDFQSGLSVTRHTYKGPQGAFEYTATAGRLRIRNDSDKPRADMFFVAYTADGRQRDARPITFLFNGGPGASSAWVHLGIAGPLRVITGAENPPAPPPYAAVENPHSWLPWTDLVFIDPVGTGFSRAVPPGEAKQFYNSREDTRSIGDFIRLYASLYGRWPSPKCLAGESYGAMRAAGLLRYLYETHGMEIDGLILISPAFDLSSIQPDTANDLPYVLFLPSFAATAWHFGKIAPEYRGDLPGVLSEAEKWAIDEYLPALALGDRLNPGRKEAVAEKFARFSGLSATLVKNMDLRVSRPDFTSELLRSEGLLLGVMDGRTIRHGIDAGGSFLNDPAMAMTLAPYAGAINDYLAGELKVPPGPVYITFSEEVNAQWNWGQLDAIDSIRKAMKRNRRLKVLAAAGYFDLDIPYFATTYMTARFGLDPQLKSNLKVSFFKGGHMFYTGNEALAEFTRETALFFRNLGI